MHVLFSLSLLFSALTNADVVKLAQAGLSAETIEAKIAASETQFDTSTDALVTLAKAGVPDRVIRAMVTAAPVPPAKPVERRPPPAAERSVERGSAPPPPQLSRAVTRRYDVAVHTATNARCEGAELRVDGKGLASTRCRKLDFKVGWSDVRKLCHDYGFRGVITVTTATGQEHRFSTVTPAEARRIVEHVRGNGPSVAVAECRR
jgi:hypothetical protein